MIAVLVLLAAMGCLALSIYKVKEWYRKNTWTADPDACEQEKVNLKMMEQARQREQVIKPEPPPDGYTEIAAPFGGHGLMDLKICFWLFCCLSFTGWQWNIQVRIRF